MCKSWIVPQGPSEAAEWAGLCLFPFPPPHTLDGEDSLHCTAAVRFFLVKNLNLTAILTKDNADVYSPWKPLDKHTMSILPALNPKCYSGNHIPYRLSAIVLLQQSSVAGLISSVSHFCVCVCVSKTLWHESLRTSPCLSGNAASSLLSVQPQTLHLVLSTQHNVPGPLGLEHIHPLAV